MENIVSPGVFTKEIDLSQLPGAVETIDTAFIGPFVKGPAFLPVKVGKDTFIKKFGKTDESLYTPYAVNEYLKYQDTATVVRTLWNNKYELNSGRLCIISAALSDKEVTGSVIEGIWSPSKDVTPPALTSPYNDFDISTTKVSFAVTVPVDGSDSVTYTFILNPTDEVASATTKLYTSVKSCIAAVKSITNGKVEMSYTATTKTFVFSAFTGTTIKVDTVALSPALTNDADGDLSTVVNAGNIDGVYNNIILVLCTSDPIKTFDYATSGLVNISGSTLKLWLTKTATNVADKPDYTFSLDPTNSNYVGKKLSTDPQTNDDIYIKYIFNDFNKYVSSMTDNTLHNFEVTYAKQSMAATSKINYSNYSNAVTPWIIDEDGNKLFKFETLSDGSYSNKEVKVSISNIVINTKDSNYAEFKVIVRNISDTDANMEILEQFNCSLNKDNKYYILNSIGDMARCMDDGKVQAVSGRTFVNKSEYIRVIKHENIINFKSNTYPAGFEGLPRPILTGVDVVRTPNVAYKIDRVLNNMDKNSTKVYFGFDYSKTDNFNYLTEMFSFNDYFFNTSGVAQNVLDDDFYLTDSFMLSDCTEYLINSNLMADENIVLRKFTVPFYGGYDGIDPTIEKLTDYSKHIVMGFDCADENSTGTILYKTAVSCVQDADNIDIKMVVAPGITLGETPDVWYAINELVKSRGDVFFPADLCGPGVSVADAAMLTNDADSNYAAVYYPWIKIYDNGKLVLVPPSIAASSAISYNDKVGYEWNAPAGLNRNSLDFVIEAERRLDFQDRELLYANRINPLASFTKHGVVIWGQKTLQVKETSLDRINVRRLLINLKKFVASTSKFLLFEPNNTLTWEKFQKLVSPYMENVKSKSGLYVYQIIMDDKTTTPDLIDRKTMKGIIRIQPTQTSEIILIDFELYPTGATFTQ